MNEIKEIRKKVKSLRVLVVDDEVTILEGTTLFLKKFFENVDSASNGEIALDMYKENSNYDLIITDIKMPKMSGWELIEELRSLDKELYIVAMSGSPEEKDYHAKSMNIFLEKPVNLNDMIKMMTDIIDYKGL